MTALLLASAGTVAAASNSLGAPAVAPTTGTTSTDFGLRVSYDSAQEFPATRVVALVAGRTVTMALVAGTATHGTYEATTRLPAGRWPVTFAATASQGKSPTLAGPTVVVTAPATVTPRPAPTSTPRSTPVPVPPATPPPPPPGAVTAVPAPTAAVATGSASASPAPGGVPDSAPPPAGVVVGTPGGAVLSVGEPSAAANASGSLFVELAVLAIVGLGAAWWMVGTRRRRPPAPPAAAHHAAATPGPVRPPPRRIAEWELAALDDEPIGTVHTYGQRP